MKYYGPHARIEMTSERVACACGWECAVESRGLGKRAFTQHLTETKPPKPPGIEFSKSGWARLREDVGE